MSISSYWAHPAMLAAFPAAERAWMVLSPAAAACLVTGVVQLVRRTELSARAIRYEMWLTGVAGAGMVAFLSGALCWIAAGADGPQRLFHAGIIDLAGLAVLVVALATGAQAGQATLAVLGQTAEDR